MTNETIPTTSPPPGGLKTLPQDLLASLVVFLVALPLCMGIAIASGVPPAAGLISGIIGGIVVGSLAGAPLLVSGPAAGLSVLVFDMVQHHGLESLGPIVLLSGLFQIGFGLLRIGPWFRAMAPAVIHGMLAGIGVLIVASQIHVLVGDAPRSSGLHNLLAIPVAIWHAVAPEPGSAAPVAAAVGLLGILVMQLWSKYLAAKVKAVPAALVAVVVTTLVAQLLKLDIPYVQVPDSLWGGIAFPTWGGLWEDLDSGIFMTAAAMAVIASAETLLSVVAVDQMHTGPRARYNKELIAQGVGNTLCGIFGALPMTGVIVRSSANIQAGAKTRKSAIFHGTWLLAMVMFFPGVLKTVPVAALAAILVVTGIKLVNIQVAKQLASFGRSELLIYLTTIVAIVASNLLEGILVGLAFAALRMIYTMTSIRVSSLCSQETDETLVKIEGKATFLRLPSIAAVIESIPSGRTVLFDVSDLTFIDHSCLDLLMGWHRQHLATGGSVTIDWDSLISLYQRRPVDPQVKERLMATAMSH
jgi:MFS superfamily sulfate permease-like transporter